MLQILSMSLGAAYIILIWLKSDAFVEYMTLFKFTKIMHIDEYNSIHKDGFEGNYVDFLFHYYKDNFLVRLAACPICLSFWAGVLVFFIVGTLDGIAAAPLILFFYLLLNRML